MDTPLTVITTRAPTVLKIYYNLIAMPRPMAMMVMMVVMMVMVMMVMVMMVMLMMVMVHSSS